MTTYEVTDAENTDLLGCEQPDLEAARTAARTLVLDGHAETRIFPVRDGERDRFPSETAHTNGRGGVTFRGVWGR